MSDKEQLRTALARFVEEIGEIDEVGDCVVVVAHYSNTHPGRVSTMEGYGVLDEGGAYADVVKVVDADILRVLGGAVIAHMALALDVDLGPNMPKPVYDEPEN